MSVWLVSLSELGSQPGSQSFSQSVDRSVGRSVGYLVSKETLANDELAKSTKIASMLNKIIVTIKFQQTHFFLSSESMLP